MNFIIEGLYFYGHLINKKVMNTSWSPSVSENALALMQESLCV